MAHPAVENETPFAFDFMGLADEEGRPLLLLVAKSTHAMAAGGLELAEEQEPVSWAGRPWGKPGESSDKYEPECAFIKPATDVVLIGHAHARERATTELSVAVQVGPVRKTVRVVGERRWVKSLGQVSMTKPLPFERMPLTWERAFGGWDQHTFEPRNPVGVGFRASPRHFEEGLALPNLEDPEQPLRTFGQRVTPAGFGFTSPHWEPRAAYAGTCDAAWEETRRPLLPRDFDRRFFNAAPPGLVAPGYLRGDEPVAIVNASPRGPLSFRLPGEPPPAVTVQLGGDVRPQMRLDTVVLDTDAHQVLLLWRGHVLLENGLHDVRAIEVRRE